MFGLTAPGELEPVLNPEMKNFMLLQSFILLTGGMEHGVSSIEDHRKSGKPNLCYYVHF